MIIINNIINKFKKSLPALSILLCSFAVYGAAPHNPLTAPSTVVTEPSRTHSDDIREKLPQLAQPAAIEFCNAMQHAFTSLWPNNQDPSVRAWSEFFRGIIFQREMKISNGLLGNPVEMNEVLSHILETFTRSTPQSKQLAALFHAIQPSYGDSEASYRNLNPFLKKLNALPAYKRIKESNPYTLFLEGYLDLIQGVQNKDEAKKQNGEYKLVLSAYELNKAALNVLRILNDKRLKSMISSLSLLHQNARRLSFNDFIQYAVDHQLYLNCSSSPYFMERTVQQQKRMHGVMNLYFQLFCDSAYRQLTASEQQFYEKVDEKLREKFISHREEASRMKTVGYVVDTYVAPMVSCIALSYLLFSDLSEETTTKVFQILGGIVSGGYTVFKFIQGLYEYYTIIRTPGYNENQIRLTALYLSFKYSNRAITADSVGQQFMDYIDDHYDNQKAISQNAADAFKKGEIT
jgi:hypothetical protein